MDTRPIHFISERVEPRFDEAPVLEKKPGCPAAVDRKGAWFLLRELEATSTP